MCASPQVVIELVLATDMKQHFSILSHFTTVHRLNAGGVMTPGTSTGDPRALRPHNRCARTHTQEHEHQQPQPCPTDAMHVCVYHEAGRVRVSLRAAPTCQHNCVEAPPSVLVQSTLQV